jgi:hypothetical protein
VISKYFANSQFRGRRTRQFGCCCFCGGVGVKEEERSRTEEISIKNETTRKKVKRRKEPRKKLMKE